MDKNRHCQDADPIITTSVSLSDNQKHFPFQDLAICARSQSVRCNNMLARVEIVLTDTVEYIPGAFARMNLVHAQCAYKEFARYQN